MHMGPRNDCVAGVHGGTSGGEQRQSRVKLLSQRSKTIFQGPEIDSEHITPIFCREH